MMHKMLKRPLAQRNLRKTFQLDKKLQFNFQQMNEKQKQILNKFNEELKKIKNADSNSSEPQSIQTMFEAYQQLQNKTQTYLNIEKKRQKQDYIKNYLLNHMSEDQADQQIHQVTSSKLSIPNHLVLKKLYFGRKEILLIGVRQQFQDHSLFTKRILQKLKIKAVVLGISPDLPFFIKTEESFLWQWKRFLKDPQAAVQSKFYVSPTPNNLKEVSLHGLHIKAVKHSLCKSQEFHEMIHTILRFDHKIEQFIADPLLTPFITNGIQNLYIADLPLAKERIQQAKNISLAALRQLFQIAVQEMKKPKSFFDPSLLFPSSVLKTKLNHIINIARIVSSYNSSRIGLIVNADEAEKIAQHWQGKDQEMMTPYFNFDQSEWPKIALMECIEKLVILDLILTPVLNDYYVRYESFPFLLEETIGGKQHIGKVFMIWDYHMEKYGKLVEMARKQRANSKQTGILGTLF